ncbi:MAG: hypothetical protein KIT79_01075 [Deltaproteobacteria bacterium]|nr:hypothetical protein [Deltaproteobacteria bacterium]
MTDIVIDREDTPLLREVARDLLAYLAELHAAMEQIDLRTIPLMQKRLREIHLPKLRGVEARLELRAGLDEHLGTWLKSVKSMAAGCQTLSGPFNPANPASLLAGFHAAGDAMVALFPYRSVVSELERFFLEVSPPEGFTEPLPKADIIRREFVSDGSIVGHGLLFRPSGRIPTGRRPLAVLLHGAFGGSGEFLSLWLRTLHTWCWYGLAPKSRGATWDEKTDFPLILAEMRRLMAEEYIDPGKVLVTGLSDGGSAAYELGFANPNLFTGVSCVSGVLKPWVPVETAAQKLPVHVIHGTSDFLFPVQTARLAEQRLKAAGCPVTYRELQGLSHTYPVSKNREIAEWFDQS